MKSHVCRSNQGTVICDCLVINVLLLQFPDIIEFCETMANRGKTVIVAALDGTFQRQVIHRDYTHS